MKIVFVADASDALKMLEEIILGSYAEAKIFKARKGIETISLCKDIIPDIVIFDVRKLMIDSIEVCGTLKSIRSLKNTQVLFVIDAKSSEGYKMKALDSGADGFIVKPFEKSEINVLLRTILRLKKAEDILKKSKEPYKLLADKMTDVIWLMDLYGKSIYVSPSITKFTGFSEEEYLSQTIEERFVPASAIYGKETFAAELRRFANHDNVPKDYSITMRLEYNCKDGTSKWGELVITPYYDHENHLLGIHGVTRDIHERMLIEKSLMESEEKYRLLTSNMRDILALFDTKGKILYLNNAINEQLGLVADSLIGKSLESVIPGEVHHQLGVFLKRAAYADVSDKSYISKLKNVNGDILTFETTVLPLKNREGVVERFQSVSRNITEKIEGDIRLEEERQTRLTALIDGQELERQRISMELHDGLGQHIAGIKIKLENSSALDLEQTRRTINEVKNDFRQVIDEIRMISNNVSPTVLAQWGLVPSLSELYKQFEKNSGIDFDFTVMGNFKQISQKIAFYLYRIIQEGLTNAAKHSGATSVKLALIEKEKYFLIMMEDDGKGVSGKKYASINGNGVENMKQRTLLLKGEFNIDSEKGIGTIIRIRIPK